MGIDLTHDGFNVCGREHKGKITFVLHNAYPLFDLFFMGKIILPENKNISAVLGNSIEDQVHDGCFSRTVLPNQTDNAAAWNIEGQMV